MTEICMNHIKVSRQAYVSEDELRHLNCQGNEQCDNYQPYHPRFELPMKGLFYIPRILEEMRRER